VRSREKSQPLFRWPGCGVILYGFEVIHPRPPQHGETLAHFVRTETNQVLLKLLGSFVR